MPMKERAGGGTDVIVPSVTGLAKGPRAAHYALAVAATAVSTGARLLLDPLVGDHLVFFTYFLGVLFVAWSASLWPSVFALLLGAVVGEFLFAQPRYSVGFHLGDAENLTDFVRYLIVGVAVIAVCEAMRRARLRAEAYPEVLRVTLASIGDGVITTDARGKVDFLNPVAEALTGWTREEAVGRPLTEVFHIVNQDTRARVENPALRALREGMIVGLANHTILIARDGTERNIDDSAAPIRIGTPGGDDAGAKAGKTAGAVLVFRDITERYKVEEALNASELRFRRLFETAKDGVLILDADTRKITDANAFMCGLTGLEKGEILGKELFEIGMYNDIEENKAAFRDLQRTGYLRHDHLPVHNRRGEKVEVEFVANVYKEGDRLVAQCNVRDISERSLLVKEVAVQAEALAAQARSKDEFLAMLSHELRNPLAPIRAAAHLMRLQEGGDGAAPNPILQQACEIIERQVANLTKMVSDLSEVSRVISGRIHMEMKPVDLKQAVGHALQTTAPLFEERTHSVSVMFCPGAVWAQADPVRLEEILVNLLNNAAKYTPNGGRIAVECEIHHEGGEGHALVRVRDNGVGIEEELLPRIFDLFTQADRSLDRSSGGLGIGLSLVKRLVALQGGAIWARSQGPGQGSEFTVKLPLIREPLVLPPSEGRAPGAGTPGRKGAGSGKTADDAVRVLVVDDNVDLVTMLCGTLRLKGYIVQSAYTGPEGLRIAREWRPDIALLDIGLPGLAGYEIARRLRADHVVAVEGAGAGGVETGGKVARMKLIAITGYGREDDIAHALEAGFDGHMVKPCDMEKLEEMMAEPKK